jgi:hypothetical protein
MTITQTLELAKVEVLSCLDNATQVIHFFPEFASFLSWWDEHGSGDLGLTQAEMAAVYSQLRTDIYTFNGCLDEYRRLLLERPQHALCIGDGQYAYLLPNGELIGLTVPAGGSIALADAYDFDRSAFNTCAGGWMEETYVETRQHITSAVFVPVPNTPELEEDTPDLTIGEMVETIILSRKTGKLGAYLGNDDQTFGVARLQGMTFRVGKQDENGCFPVLHVESGTTDLAEDLESILRAVDRVVGRVKAAAGYDVSQTSTEGVFHG